MAYEEFKKFPAATQANQYVENRIYLFTDGYPNANEQEQLKKLIHEYAYSDKKIYTTIFGIGVDFNQSLVSEITKTRGAVYYSVKDSKELLSKLCTEFHYMNTIIGTDIQIYDQNNTNVIEDVYGSNVWEKTGPNSKLVANFPCAFASAYNEQRQIKGGPILIKLKKDFVQNLSALNNKVKLRIQWNDREDKVNAEILEADFTPHIVSASSGQSFFEHMGVRKAIMLAYYGDMLYNHAINKKPEEVWKVDFRACVAFLKEEMTALGDISISKEIEFLETILTDTSNEDRLNDGLKHIYGF